MTATLRKVLTRAEIETLTVDERLDLISDLWNSLDENDIELAPEHEAELKRRIESFETDKNSGVPWEIARKEILQSVK